MKQEPTVVHVVVRNGQAFEVRVPQSDVDAGADVVQDFLDQDVHRQRAHRELQAADEARAAADAAAKHADATTAAANAPPALLTKSEE